MAFPSTWQERFIKDVVRVSSKESKGSDIRWYYRGELEQIHGPQEAAEFIAKGKYIEGNDEQGDIIYRKAQKMESVIHSYERVAETERRAEVDEQGLEKNLECMQQWFNEAGFSSAGSSTGAVLDGHGGGNGSKDSKVAVISNKRGNVTKNPLSKRGLSGLLDGENEGAPPKKQKSEEEDAKAKGQHMVNHLSNTSAKLLATIDKIVPSKAAASIILLAKEKQKELERMRGVVLKASSDTKKFNVEELKRLCVKGAQRDQGGHGTDAGGQAAFAAAGGKADVQEQSGGVSTTWAVLNNLLGKGCNNLLGNGSLGKRRASRHRGRMQNKTAQTHALGKCPCSRTLCLA